MRKKQKIKRSLISKLMFILLLKIKDIHSLTMENVIVPSYVVQGETVEMTCRFHLEQDNLYSVIWYKDHEEFYRYIPKSVPKQQTFKLDGAKIDVGINKAYSAHETHFPHNNTKHQNSDAQSVKMRIFSPAASGIYRCEVSAEAPSFTSVQDEARMEVVLLPEDDPVITGDIRLRHYQEGDNLTLNCTAGISQPPAQIVWFINDKQVHAWSEHRGNLDKGTISELHLQLSSIHLTRENLSVRCVTIVGSQQLPVDTRKTVLLVRGMTNGSESIDIFNKILIIILISCITKIKI